MRRLRINMIARHFLLAFYVLAAVTVGFAHRPLALASGADLAAYALPDGTLPVICGTGSTEPGSLPAKRHAGAVCDACLLTSAPGLLPAESDSLTYDAAPPAAVLPTRLRAPGDQNKPLNIRSRAPPSLPA